MERFNIPLNPKNVMLRMLEDLINISEVGTIKENTQEAVLRARSLDSGEGIKAFHWKTGKSY